MKIGRILCAILALGIMACSEPDYGRIPNTVVPSLGKPSKNEIWFSTTDGKELIGINPEAFNAEIEEIIYSEYDINIIRFASELTYIGEGAFRGCYNIFNISLPHSVQRIGKSAFYDCSNMECLTLGAGLTSCEELAFDGCYALHSLHINSIKDWCEISFSTKTSNPLYFSQSFVINGERVKEIYIPQSIEQISDYAFYGNAELQLVKIPDSIVAIGKNAFGECDRLSKVEISDISKWCQIEFANETANPLWIADVFMHNGTAVTTVNITDIDRISAYAFINCQSITSLATDSTLEVIGDNAFRNCTALASATLGSGVLEIGKQAFMNCGKLISVTCYAEQPPVLDNGDVFSYNHKQRVFNVPQSAYENYIDNIMWSKYADYIQKL